MIEERGPHGRGPRPRGPQSIRRRRQARPDVAGLPTRTIAIRDQLLPAKVDPDRRGTFGPGRASDDGVVRAGRPAVRARPGRRDITSDEPAELAEGMPAWDLSVNFVPVTYPGYVPARIDMVPGSAELWRVINAGADTILNIQVPRCAGPVRAGPGRAGPVRAGPGLGKPFHWHATGPVRRPPRPATPPFPPLSLTRSLPPFRVRARATPGLLIGPGPGRPRTE